MVLLCKDDLSAFQSLLDEQMKALKPEQFEYHYDIIDHVSLDDINLDFMDTLERFAPFGQKFDYPIFYLDDCCLKGGRDFGNRYQKSAKQHVSFLLVLLVI